MSELNYDRELASIIDHTLLDPEATKEDFDNILWSVYSCEYSLNRINQQNYSTKYCIALCGTFSFTTH